MKKYLYIFLAATFLVGANWYILAKPIVSTSAGSVFYLKAGLSKRTAIKALYQQGVITHPIVLASYAYLISGGQLKTGEYLFPQQASMLDMWRQLTTGTGFYYRPLMIIPGWTFKEVRQVLAKTLELKQTLPALSNQQIMTKLGYPHVSPEGEFLPETYFYTRGDTDFSILKRAFDLMQTEFAKTWIGRDAHLPYQSSYQALIVASMIEKEVFLNTERAMIAGVIVNRLNKNMLLQIDPTVIFGLGDNYTGTITKADLQKNTPYNTYLHKGLPPTPISMPSISAIQAALHPATHQYYYFVAHGDGSHQFSETLAEHNAASSSVIATPSSLRKQGSSGQPSKIPAFAGMTESQ